MTGESEDGDTEFAVALARQEARRRQGALLVLQDCCRRAGAAVGELRRAERDGFDCAFDDPARERIHAARRRLAGALRALEEAAFDPLVLSAAELAEAEEEGDLDESPFS
jgi:hypothetical protein